MSRTCSDIVTFITVLFFPPVLHHCVYLCHNVCVGLLQLRRLIVLCQYNMRMWGNRDTSLTWGLPFEVVYMRWGSMTIHMTMSKHSSFLSCCKYNFQDLRFEWIIVFASHLDPLPFTPIALSLLLFILVLIKFTYVLVLSYTYLPIAVSKLFI